MQLMEPGTQLAFLWRLVAGTQEGAVSWSKVNDYSFGCRLGRFAYFITSRDSDDFAPYSFSIYRLTDNDSQEPLEEWTTGEFSPLNDPLQALYLEVKPRVLGLKNIVAEMFEDLAAADGGSKEPESIPLPPRPEF